MQQLRSRCRHQNCRTKLTIPTDNHHKAFCTPDCHRRFYKRKCLVCEKDLPDGHRRQLCSAPKCRTDYRNFRTSYVLENGPAARPEPKCIAGSKSPCGTGGKIALKDRIANLRAPATARIIAGPSLSDFSLWAATLDPPPYRPVVGWVSKPPPGTIAAEWEAREWSRREADDARYVAEDEERLRTEPVDASGNYAPRHNIKI